MAYLGPQRRGRSAGAVALSPLRVPRGSGAGGPCPRRRLFPSGSRAFGAGSRADTPLPGSSRVLPSLPLRVGVTAPPQPIAVGNRTRPLGLFGSNLQACGFTRPLWGGPAGGPARMPAMGCPSAPTSLRSGAGPPPGTGCTTSPGVCGARLSLRLFPIPSSDETNEAPVAVPARPSGAHYPPPRPSTHGRWDAERGAARVVETRGAGGAGSMPAPECG